MKDVIIILGGGINKDGTLKEYSRTRVEKGVQLYKEGKANKILISGKHAFVIDYKPKKTEAEAMKQYAIKLGAEKTDILKEEQSKDTVNNAFFVRKLFLEPKKWRNIIIVTSEYHMPRAKITFNKILGRKFNIEFIESNSKLSKQELQKKKANERKNIELIKKSLNKIPFFLRGNLKVMEKIIYFKHPAYSKNPNTKKEDNLEKIQKSQY